MALNALGTTGFGATTTTTTSAPVFTNPTNTNNFAPFFKSLKKGQNERPIRFRSFLQNTILEVLKSRGWQEVNEYSNQIFYKSKD